MNENLVKINEYENFENDWGFYVDLENPYIPIYKNYFVKEKYLKTCYHNSYDKIEEDLEYYEYEYNKKIEEKSKQLDEASIIKMNLSSLLLNISSVTLITAALSYCFLVAL